MRFSGWEFDLIIACKGLQAFGLLKCIQLAMLLTKRYGVSGPLVVTLHWLGGSARTWAEVCEQLGFFGFRCASIDLPGFGQSNWQHEFSLEEMLRAVISTIWALRKDEMDTPWLLAGHSMGGKLAAMIARAAEQGDEGLANLQGLVLLSPSPPGPEPMEERKRANAVRSLGPDTRNPEERRKHAEAFVDDNTGVLPLLEAVRERSIEDVLIMNPDALVAWMKTGSKIDCSMQVGVLNTPTLILAGTEEAELGPEAQTKHTIPHFGHATLVALEGGGHLAPLERPFEVSDRMAEFFRALGAEAVPAIATLSPKFRALINSDYTSSQTRKALLERMNVERETAGVMNAEERRMLRALAARVIPNAGFDLAAQMDQLLAQSTHDGWRFNTLPSDAKAWKRGLASLDAAARSDFGVPFVALDAERQDGLLGRAKDGTLRRSFSASLNPLDSTEIFNAIQIRDWFEDVRGELVKIYVADPRTMERIGFTGFADEAGFTKIKLSEQNGDQI